MLHDIFIGTVIIVILSVQIMVFNHASKKINLFKEIIPDNATFKMVKVYIPESKIKSLTVEEVFKNEHFYIPNSSDNEQALLEIEKETPSHTDYEYLEQNPDTEIWISNGNEEKKIAYRDLENLKTLGWEKI